MSSFNSIGQHEATAVIPEFKGLMQQNNTDPRYAVSAVNFETFGGVLQPAAACVKLEPQLSAPIVTLARLWRRWYVGADERELLVAASGGKLYAMLPSANAWTQLAFPTGVSSYQSDVWSWVSYEINPQGSTSSIDVLLLSNALDGMVMVRGDNLSVTKVETPYKFGVIERYAERIWGGAIIDEPDTLAYSAPFDPTDWEPNLEIPEDGAGDIRQPSWDGDSFVALKAFGSQLIAFKKHRVWRILGTDPGEYTFKEQYGGGAPYERTIAVGTEQIFTLSDKGLQLYDGLAVAPFQQYCLDTLWPELNKGQLDKACAIWWNNHYYLALPKGESTINNIVVIYNAEDRTWLIRNDAKIEQFLAGENAMYFTSSSTPGCIWVWKEDSWKTKSVSSSSCLWSTPWNDLGLQDAVKANFNIYLTPEVQDDPVNLTLVLETDRRQKSRTFTVKVPERNNNVGARPIKIYFSGSGKRFRLHLVSKAAKPWRLGGISVHCDIDRD